MAPWPLFSLLLSCWSGRGLINHWDSAALCSLKVGGTRGSLSLAPLAGKVCRQESGMPRTTAGHDVLNLLPRWHSEIHVNQAGKVSSLHFTGGTVEGK